MLWTYLASNGALVEKVLKHTDTDHRGHPLSPTAHSFQTPELTRHPYATSDYCQYFYETGHSCTQDSGGAGQVLWPPRDTSGTVAVRVELDRSHVPFKGRGWET